MNDARPDKQDGRREVSGEDTLTVAPTSVDPVLICALLSERVVVGAALLGNVAPLVTLNVESDLTDPKLQLVAAAVNELISAGAPVEPASVWAQMQRTALEPWRYPTALAVFLADLIDVDSVPQPASAGWHAVLLRDLTRRRALLVQAEQLQREARAGLSGVVV